MEGYPKTKYPKVGGGSITVASPEQEKNLGDGWQDHPPFVVPESNPTQMLADAERDLREVTGKFEPTKKRKKEEIEAT